MNKSRQQRKTTRIPREKQIDMFGGAAASPPPTPKPQKQSDSVPARVFVAPDPDDIYLGNTPLKTHLKEAGLKEPLVVRKLLQKQDWSTFEARYAPTGRPPYAPSAMMGLILYGVLQGVSSLRGLEKLARRDLGCMWVSGGICPDHAIIGRFITLHDASIQGEFFEQLTNSVLRVTGSNGDSLAGDGTVVEAACSHYDLLKAEAMRERAEQAQCEAQSTPEDTRKQQVAAQTEQALANLQARAQARRQKGKPHDHLRISPQEPDAMIQPLKRGRGVSPSYKPSVLANEVRVVLALDVHPSSENAVLQGMLEQSAAVTGHLPKELLLDAGYFNDHVIETALDNDISLLCSEGREPGEPKHSDKCYPKSRFEYDEIQDCYHCPAGAKLIPISQYQGKDSRPGYTLYGSDACGNCDERNRCTRNRLGRRIKRYAGDTAKDALRQVMQQPKAQRRLKKRKAMVESVFSTLRGNQGLNRFRRRGLSGVKTEFALHVLAYNLSRALAHALFYAFLATLIALQGLFGATRHRKPDLVAIREMPLTFFEQRAAA